MKDDHKRIKYAKTSASELILQTKKFKSSKFTQKYFIDIPNIAKSKSMKNKF